MGAQSIVDFARSLIGSHYLWGSGGDAPGANNGVWYRQTSVSLAPSSLDPASPCVFAAQCDQAGHYVCAGRFKTIRGGRYANSTDWDLQNYLSGLAGQSEDSWQPYYTSFTPRVVRGRNVSNDGKIVWGEDCRSARHFDCISFVNFVLSQMTKPSWHYSIAQYDANSSGVTTSIDLNDAAVPGDILIRNTEHIALLCEDSTVIQAQDHATGVHNNEDYHSIRWTGRWRVADSQICDTL
jgi:cell wall-associated NlpC family hydrolase